MAWFNPIRVVANAVRYAATWTAATVLGSQGYQVLDPGRKILSVGQRRSISMTANELATMSLPQLRALCRRLERDNPTARASGEGLVAQVVGMGIALEPDHGDDQVNAKLRAVWQEYIAGCDITGKRSIYSLQEQAMRDVVFAGEILWRMVTLPDRAKAGLVPVVVLPLECEWLAQDVPVAAADGLTMVAGIEVNKWGVPIAYNLRNPEMSLSGQTERVSAKDIIHDFEHRRALQNRGEPWLTPVIERIAQEGDLVDAELKAAITCAGIAVVVTSAAQGPVDTSTYGTPEDPVQGIAINSVARLYPGEKAEAFSHNRPGQQIQAFRQGIRGDISSAMRISQRWLDRDYSRANYSSMRADMLDSDRLLAPVREWLGHATIGEVYRRALPYLCILASVQMPKRVAYRLLPDGQPYVDPQKDVAAALEAVDAGLSTREYEISRRGGDYKKVWEQLAKEKAEAAALGLTFATSQPTAPAGTQPEQQPADENAADPAQDTNP